MTTSDFDDAIDAVYGIVHDLEAPVRNLRSLTAFLREDLVSERRDIAASDIDHMEKVLGNLEDRLAILTDTAIAAIQVSPDEVETMATRVAAVLAAAAPAVRSLTMSPDNSR